MPTHPSNVVPVDRGIVVVLGSTGRLGPAVIRALGPERVRGLSRRPAGRDETAPAVFVEGRRRDVDALRKLLDGADTVVDLLGFDEADADALLTAVASVASPPRHLVFASSVAELERSRGGGPPGPDGAHGRGKRAARLRYEADFPGPVHTLVLPRLVAEVDPGLRDRPYLESAAGGRVLVAGGGDQRLTVAPVGGVAEVVRRLVADPEALPPGPVVVGAPEPVVVAELVTALLDGAGLRVPLARHPDADWRGPHGGGDEIYDTGRLAAAFPDLAWQDPREVSRRHGEWLAAHLPDDARPRDTVQKAHRAFRGHAVVDVHGVRAPPALADPRPELAELAGWLTPGFYLDTGRPCNAACLYCAVSPHADTEGFAPLSRFDEMIAAGRAAGATRAILIGGEPTIHPKLDAILGRLADAGLPHGHVVMTNGLLLADPARLEALVAGGIETFHLSIDTADPDVYRRLARGAGRLETQQATLDALLRRPAVNLYVYTCVTRMNADGLGALLSDVAHRAESAGRAPPPLVLGFAKPIGDALTHAAALIPEPADRARIARAAVADADRLGVPLGLRNLQACLAPELVRRSVDYYLEDYSVDLARHARVPFAHSAYWRRGDPCHACAHREVCTGIYEDDLGRFGAGAFRALADDPALAAPASKSGESAGAEAATPDGHAEADTPPATAVLRLEIAGHRRFLLLADDPEARRPSLARAGGWNLSYEGDLEPEPLRDGVVALGRRFDVAPPGRLALPDAIAWLGQAVADATPDATLAELRRLPAGQRIARWTPRRRQPPPATGPGLWPFDPEVVGLLAGTRRLLKREVRPGADAEAETAQLTALGLSVRAVPAGERVVLLAAREAGEVAAAEAAERALSGGTAAAPAVQHLGEALGYPACCVSAIQDLGSHDDLTLAATCLPALGARPAPPETQWLVPPLALVSHVPCSLECDATRALAARLLEALDADCPGFADRWRSLARRVQVVDAAGRAVSLAVADGPLSGATVDEAVSLREDRAAPGGVRLETRGDLVGARLEVSEDGLAVGGPAPLLAALVADHRG